MSVLVFIIILSFLVIIHELGHFLVARRFGMKVEEFGIGYPPKALTYYRDKRGTEYTLNWLPFGGFVRIMGEDGSEAVSKSAEEMAQSFAFKPVGWRLMVIAAGATINFLFGALAFGAIYTHLGIPTQYPYAVIESVAPGSPAEKAGIKAQDAFEAVEFQGKITEIKSVDDFVGAVSNYKGQTITLLREKSREPVPVYVRSEAEVPAGEGAVGVVVTDFQFARFPVWQMPFRGMAYGLETAVKFGGLLFQALGDMAGKLFKGQVPQDVSGPVGIAYVAQRDGILSGGFLQQLNFAAILSINLAIVNILPIPALDGGRAAFIIVEMIIRRKLKPELEQRVNTVGFLVLVLLLIAISVKDVGMVAADHNVQQWFKGLF